MRLGDPAEHSYTEIVDVLRVIGAAAQADIDELWWRVALSILINIGMTEAELERVSLAFEHTERRHAARRA
jgi:serine/threonine-protein kinase HipA